MQALRAAAAEALRDAARVVSIAAALRAGGQSCPACPACSPHLYCPDVSCGNLDRLACSPCTVTGWGASSAVLALCLGVALGLLLGRAAFGAERAGQRIEEPGLSLADEARAQAALVRNRRGRGEKASSF